MFTLRLSFLILCAVALSAQAYPGVESRADTDKPGEPKQKFVLIKEPPRPNPNGAIAFPEPGHEFIAPGPNDLRGPCPGLNTLANHGYLPRSGVVSFEDLVTGVSRVYNMEYGLTSGLAGFTILARGNAYINKISIGFPSPLVPSLPGGIDGPVARGMGTHGRVEGDVSLTRSDAAIGNQKDFNATLFAQWMDVAAVYGGDSPVTGPKSIINHAVFQEYKYKRFLDSQRDDPLLQFHAGRLLLSYWETSFVLNMFANGTTGLATVPIVTSFFRDQTFPKNWHRRDGAATFQIIANDASINLNAHPITPGANAPNGTYVADPEPINDCSIYTDFVQNNLPAVLLTTKGDLRRNVDFLLQRMHNIFPNCPTVYPSGPANI